MPDLSHWLRQFGLEPLASVLADNDVDLDILPDLTEPDLEKLGISLGHRRKLLKAIATLRGSPERPPEKLERQLAPPAAGAPAAEAERRQVTVLFSDLVGSTALATALDPEDLGRLIKRYQDACAGSVARFDGYIAKFMGDGVLAYFGYPQAHEDDAERSVRAALAIVEAVRQIKTPNGAPLETRVGIATGLVVVGDIVGTGAAREEAIVGETPNLAARLQALAEPNTVLVSEATFRLLGRAFEYQSGGDHKLKGFANPIPVWRVLGEASVASRFAAVRSGLGPFVGRAQEMGLLLARWHLAQQGEGQAVLLTAEPGMGKSRLVEALFERIATEPHHRLVLQCSPYYSNTAFHPVLHQIELAAGFLPADSVEQKLDKLENLLTRAGTAPLPTVPLLADLLSLPTDGRYPALDLTPPQRKNATVSALVDHFVRLSVAKPVLLILEDAHWIDPTTQDLLTRLIDSIGAARLLVIITGRPEFVSPWSGRDHVVALALARLGRAHCAEIVGCVVTGHAIPPDLMEEILAKTDGVPLFVEELTKAVVESPTPDRLAVPSTLQDSLMARLDRLGGAKEIAQIAATIGRQFLYSLLAAIVPIGTAELDAALAKLIDANLIFPQSRAIEPSYSFKHALTRDVAYDSLLRARRQQLHERIARTLEELYPGVPTQDPEILAYHFGRAALPGPACDYAQRAGERAIARSAYAEAVAHFSAALTEAGRLPPGEDRERRELSVLLKYGPALIVFKGYRNNEVENVYQRAYDIAKPSADDQTIFKAAWGLWLCANMERRTDVARNRAEELVTLAQRCGDEALFLEALHCRWSTALFCGDVPRALSDSREGIRHYDPERHQRLAVEFGGHDPGVCAHAVLGLSLAQFGDVSAAARSAEQAFSLARRLNQPSSLVHAITNALITHQVIGDRDAIRRFGGQMVDIAGKFNLPVQRSIANFYLAWANARDDRVEDELQVMESEFARVSHATSLSQHFAAVLAGVRLDAGHPQQAIDLLDPVLATVREPGVGFYLPEIRRLRGEALLQLGDGQTAAAASEFESAIAIAKQQRSQLFQLRAALSLARLWAARGAPERGRAPLVEAVDLFEGSSDMPNLAPAREIISAATVK